MPSTLSWSRFLFLLDAFLLKFKSSSLENAPSNDLDTLNFGVYQNTVGDGACPELVNPTNGRFDCVETHGLGVSPRQEGNKTCTLKCNDGYVLPLIQATKDGKPVLLENIGVYKCFTKTGKASNRREWVPKKFFDCIPKRRPTECKLYFYLTLTTKNHKCYPSYERIYEFNFLGLSASFVSHFVCQANNLTCLWNFHVRCIQNTTAWMVVAIATWPFVEENVVSMNNLIQKSFEKDVKKIKVVSQQNVPARMDTMGKVGFQVICPRGTRFARDFNCHGCSKGYFMNEIKMECEPCPRRTYQDKNLQTTCKLCPEKSNGAIISGAHITSCYKIHELLQETDFLTMVFCLSTVVTFLLGLISFYKYIHVIQEEEEEEKEDEKVSTKANPKMEGKSKARVLPKHVKKEKTHKPHSTSTYSQRDSYNTTSTAESSSRYTEYSEETSYDTESDAV